LVFVVGNLKLFLQRALTGMANNRYDYKRLSVLLNAMQSLDNAGNLLNSACTPVLVIEGVVGGKCSESRIPLLNEAVVDARETLLLEISASLQRYQQSVEREFNKTIGCVGNARVAS